MLKSLLILSGISLSSAPIGANVLNTNRINFINTIDLSQINNQQQTFVPGYAVHTVESFTDVLKTIVLEQLESKNLFVKKEWIEFASITSSQDGRDINSADISGIEKGASSEIWNVSIKPTNLGKENGLVNEANFKLNLVFLPGDITQFNNNFVVISTPYILLSSIQNHLVFELTNSLFYTHGNAIYFAQLGGLNFTQLYKYDDNNNIVLITQQDIDNAIASNEELTVFIQAKANDYGISKGLTGTAEFNVKIQLLL